MFERILKNMMRHIYTIKPKPYTKDVVEDKDDDICFDVVTKIPQYDLLCLYFPLVEQNFNENATSE